MHGMPRRFQGRKSSASPCLSFFSPSVSQGSGVAQRIASSSGFVTPYPTRAEATETSADRVRGCGTTVLIATDARL